MLTKGLDKLLAAYSSVLHLEPPADRTVEAIDRFISTDKLHGHKPWLGHPLKYRMVKDGDRMTFTDLVSLYTPAENDYLSRFVDKFLYPLFLVCLHNIIILVPVFPFSCTVSNIHRPPGQAKKRSTSTNKRCRNSLLSWARSSQLASLYLRCGFCGDWMTTW